MSFIEIGALAFGLVIGWLTYRTIIFRKEDAALADIAIVIGAVGGAAITGIFKDPNLFAGYSIGLAAGFFFFAIAINTFWKNADLN